jgi:hypothetical protein
MLKHAGILTTATVIPRPPFTTSELFLTTVPLITGYVNGLVFTNLSLYLNTEPLLESEPKTSDPKAYWTVKFRKEEAV